jgi:hypothetical protein
MTFKNLNICLDMNYLDVSLVLVIRSHRSPGGGNILHDFAACTTVAKENANSMIDADAGG